MYHVKKAELFEEKNLPEMSKDFVISKCGLPETKPSGIIVYDRRASTAMGMPRAIKETAPRNDGLVSREEFMIQLKNVYDFSGIGGVQELLIRYGKPYMIKDFVKWLLARWGG